MNGRGMLACAPAIPARQEASCVFAEAALNVVEAHSDLLRVRDATHTDEGAGAFEDCRSSGGPRGQPKERLK